MKKRNKKELLFIVFLVIFISVFFSINLVFAQDKDNSSNNKMCFSDNDCAWCGLDCVKWEPNLICPLIIPPEGYDCVCNYFSHECQAVPSQPKIFVKKECPKEALPGQTIDYEIRVCKPLVWFDNYDWDVYMIKDQLDKNVEYINSTGYYDKYTHSVIWWVSWKEIRFCNSLNTDFLIKKIKVKIKGDNIKKNNSEDSEDDNIIIPRNIVNIVKVDAGPVPSCIEPWPPLKKVDNKLVKPAELEAPQLPLNFNSEEESVPLDSLKEGLDFQYWVEKLVFWDIISEKPENFDELTGELRDGYSKDFLPNNMMKWEAFGLGEDKCVTEIIPQLVSVDVQPKEQHTEINNPVIYNIKIKDNHLPVDCIQETDCHIYYTYNIDVFNLPHGISEYPKKLRIYQGSSQDFKLYIEPDEAGKFRFTVRATLENNPNVYDEDSATLIVEKKENKVYVNPEEKNVKPNTEFNLSININSVDEIYAEQFNLFFNPDILEALSVDEGNFLKKDGASTYPVINVDNDKGEIIFGNTRLQVQTGVSGQGSLAIIKFKAIKKGTSNLELNNLKLVDPEANPVDVLVFNGVVKVLELSGDVNNDCVVNIFDLAIVAKSFASKEGEPRYKPEADLNNDNKIDIFDLATVGLNYGKTC